MTDALTVKVFLKFRRKIGKIGLFLDIFEDRFIIGNKRFASRFTKMTDTAQSKGNEDPFYVFSSLGEVAGFVAGFCYPGKDNPL